MTKFTIRPQFASESSAGYLTIVIDTPELRGSEKQVAWAQDIRAKKMRQIAEELAKAAGVVWGAVLQNDVEYINTCCDALDKYVADPSRAPAIEQVAQIFAIDDARFWIDNRGDSGVLMMIHSANKFLAANK